MERPIVDRQIRVRAIEYSLPLTLFTVLVLFCFALNFAFTTSLQSSAVIDLQIKSLHWIDPKTDVGAAARELAGRYLIQAAYLLLFSTALFGSVYSGAICFLQRKRLRLEHLVIIPALAAISFFVSYFSDNTDYDPFWNSALPGYLTIAASRHAGFAMFDHLSTWSGDVTILSMCMSGAAVSVLIAVAPRSPKDTPRKSIVTAAPVMLQRAFVDYLRGFRRLHFAMGGGAFAEKREQGNHQARCCCGALLRNH